MPDFASEIIILLVRDFDKALAKLLDVVSTTGLDLIEDLLRKELSARGMSEEDINKVSQCCRKRGASRKAISTRF